MLRITRYRQRICLEEIDGSMRVACCGAWWLAAGSRRRHSSWFPGRTQNLNRGISWSWGVKNLTDERRAPVPPADSLCACMDARSLAPKLDPVPVLCSALIFSILHCASRCRYAEIKICEQLSISITKDNFERCYLCKGILLRTNLLL